LVTKTSILFACILIGAFAARALAAEWDIGADRWTATDALGRRLPGFKECGPPKKDKFVGIFYFDWLGQHSTTGPHDITKILAANPDNPQWGPEQHFHHWGESEVGYYVSTDEWVIRRHCRMLTQAGIDTIILDVTNSFTYTPVYMKICEIYAKMRSEGIATPQMCFMAHSNEEATVQKLYDEFYAKNLYPELWFKWDGKPLILANPTNMSKQVKDFFTFRESWAWHDPNGWYGDGKGKWPWLDGVPQAPGLDMSGNPEEICVCVAQHPMTNIGRSFHDGKEPDVPKPAQGIYFADQWKHALEVNPQFIFITGWNEWVAQRFLADGVTNLMTGRKLAKGESFFVDTCSQEYSRDIEPMKGGHTDNYYFQMIDGIRRFKGVRAPEKSSGPKTIRIDGKFDDWKSVRPEFRDWIGDTEHRDSKGWGDSLRYENKTGRNDFVRLKVAYDSKNVYFYAETKDPITSPKDPNWMLLFISTGASNPSTSLRTGGWNGYDFFVGEATGSWKHLTHLPKSSYAVSGNKMELAIPRSALGLVGKPVKINFHWADNIQKPDIIEFSVSGDSAPDRRFNYHLEER
jgi:hypothetical protein